MSVAPCPKAGIVHKTGKPAACDWLVWPCGTWVCANCGATR